MQSGYASLSLMWRLTEINNFCFHRAFGFAQDHGQKALEFEARLSGSPNQLSVPFIS